MCMRACQLLLYSWLWWQWQASSPPPLLLQLFTGNASLAYTLMVNQTALHGLPGAINSMNSALLRAITGNIAGAIITTSHPLPTLPDEVSVKVSQLSGQAVRGVRQDFDACQATFLPPDQALNATLCFACGSSIDALRPALWLSCSVHQPWHLQLSS